MTFKTDILWLLTLSFLLCVLGFIFFSFVDVNISIFDFLVLTGCFAAIIFIVLLIFNLGNKKEPPARTIYLIAAIGIKMLLEMVLALFWFFNFKKTSTGSLLLFFVLYLAFSLFSIIIMLNTLKTRSLQSTIDFKNAIY